MTSPALLFFFLGIVAVRLKSDLEIPKNSAKFISIYLLFSIGFKGGQELAHSHFDWSLIWALLFGVLLAAVIPLYTFFILKRKFNTYNASALAAAYGSVSAVTFVTSASYLELRDIHFDGYMVAVMALMEAPSIVVGVILLSFFNKEKKKVDYGSILKHAFSNGSVLLIMGSLVIGFVASESQAAGIKPFTTDIFKGFLAIFLLDMGITSGQKLQNFFNKGWFPVVFAILIPAINGCVVALASQWITPDEGNRFIYAILAASASYIAVPAAMRLVNPKSSPSLYLPMALGVTFPFNITLGMPLYMYVIQMY